MLSEDTQNIVNVISGALLGLFLLLNFFVSLRYIGILRNDITSKAKLLHIAAFLSFYVYAGILVLTFYISPVDIRWSYFLGGLYGSALFAGVFASLLRKNPFKTQRHDNGKNA